ncbi:serine aminopeptidase domain-containing protein [Pelagibacterium xiamenense]|uniref:serine aminopeptidase domain-containing protein n=1 Tax=Pelagibacterium xiamenense TaxID=2901140 RepID=UPI001E318290|nr:alpha/beta hydrolase [Pelagibacterium xiamenense]MCD7060700.1 alpha/beta hydrolase [Pelagibacterium xiamenense]
MDTEFLVGDSSQPLLFRKWTVDPGSRPAEGHRAVFLGHSQPTHSGMLNDLGAAFRQLGWNTYSGDIRGHGKSTGSHNPLGHLDYEGGWQRAVADMRLFFEKSFAGIPWEHRLVVVPNITALLTLEVLKSWPDLARHIVLISPPPNQRAIAMFGKTFSQTRCKLGTADAPDEQSLHHLYAFLGSHLKERRHPADVMSADRALIDSVVADPLGWPTPTPAYWYNIFSGMLSAWKWPKSASVVPGTRCLILFGGEDAMLRDGGFLPPVERFLERVGFDDIASARIEGARSALFLEEKRFGIAERIVRWVGEEWHPEEEGPEIGVAELTSELLAMTSGLGASVDMSPGELVELCYNAIDDESRWNEIIYRMIYEAERSGDLAEAALHKRILSLMPHWERSFNLNRQVMMNATLGVLLQSVIERLQIGVAILDGEGELLHSNRTYFEALARLFPASGLSGSEKGVANALTGRLLRGERAGPTKRMGHRDTLIVHDDMPVAVRFYPDALKQTSLQRQGPASVLVLRTDPGGDLEADSRMALVELAYGLTGKEAEIALLIAGGRSPEEAAETLGILVSTVRGHLKKAFSKMNVHSQSELTSRLLSGPLGWLG